MSLLKVFSCEISLVLSFLEWDVVCSKFLSCKTSLVPRVFRVRFCLFQVFSFEMSLVLIFLVSCRLFLVFSSEILLVPRFLVWDVAYSKFSWGRCRLFQVFLSEMSLFPSFLVWDVACSQFFSFEMLLVPNFFVWDVACSKFSRVRCIISIITISHLVNFSTPAMAGGYSLESEWQVSWTLLGILADLNNAVVWIILILALISSSSRPLSKPLRTVPSARTTIGITVTFMFYSCFSYLARSKYLSIF